MESEIIYSVVAAVVVMYVLYLGIKNFRRLKDPKAQPGYKTQIKK